MIPLHASDDRYFAERSEPSYVTLTSTPSAIWLNARSLASRRFGPVRARDVTVAPPPAQSFGDLYIAPRRRFHEPKKSCILTKLGYVHFSKLL